MSWIPGLYAERRRSRSKKPPAIIEVLETRALLATVTVDVVNFAFSPSTVTINVGDTVQWVWQSSNHSATSVAGSAEQWDSGVQNTGFTFDHTFTHAATYVYYCVIHGRDNGNGTASGMDGKIIVGSGNPPPPPPMGTLNASGHNAKAKLDKTFHATLANFNEPHTKRGDFTVLIAWGDQSSPTFGQIHGRKNRFKVRGSHRYLTPGVFQVMVMIQDTSGQMVNVMDMVTVTGK
jgi:plastocyanin